MRLCLTTTVLLAVIVAALAVSCMAGGGVLWQVGKCDGSYAEFGIAGHQENYTRDFPGGATFEVGKGDPAKDWVYIQPGPDDKWAGEGEHPFEVVFNLDEVPKGPFELKVDLVDVSPTDAPTLRVRINDNVCSYDLKAGASQKSLTDPTKGRSQSVLMCAAGGFLHQGRNVVNLTITKGSYVLYDCISLSQIDKAPHVVQGLTLRPTFLFKKRGDRLYQIEYATFDLFQDLPSVRTELTSDSGLKLEQDFRDVRSGTRNLELEIPAPMSRTEKVALKLHAGDEIFEARGEIVPQKQWKVYLMPSTHLDIGYTDIQDKALKVHLDNVDRALDWFNRFPHFIWNLEGSIIADEYLKKGSRGNDMLDMGACGRIGVMGFYANELTGICSSESLSRLIDFYDFLRKAHDVESDCAMMNDVPSMVGTVPMILAGHGIKYLSHGMNFTRARGDQEPMQRPFYWESPDGSKVLMWKLAGYAQSAELTDLDDEGNVQLCRDRVSSLISEFARRTDYPFDAILMHGAYGDNWGSGVSIAEVPEQWNKLYEYPKLVFCKGKEFFQYIEANFAKDITTVKGDGGGWWEDGANSSAHETGITRVAKEQLVTAEKLTSLCDRDYQRAVGDRFSDAWRNVLLYDEHTWGSACSIDDPTNPAQLAQWAVKKSFADNAADAARKLLDESADKFASQIHAAKDSVLVFNPSSWPRSGIVWYSLPEGNMAEFVADSVPPMGYKLFDVPKAGAGSVPVDGDAVLDNRFYTVKFDPKTGAVMSIFDKDLKREVVDSSTYGLGGYLYATAKNPGSLLGYSTEKPDIKLDEVAATSLIKSVSDDLQSMIVTGEVAMAKSYRSRVVLHNDQKRIDFICDIDRIPNRAKEAGYFAFPFAFKNPTIRLEIPDGVIRPEIDQIKAACKDWFCVQQFLTVADDSAAVVWTALDSPLVTLEDINRGQWYDHLKIENGSVFAYVFSNYWWTNYKADQEGPHTFRFALTSGKSFTDAEAKHFGESVQSPMVARYVKAGGGTNSAASQSFVSVDGGDFVVQAVMPARFSEGTVIRLREMNGKSREATLKVNGISYDKAYLCNLAEDELQQLDVKDGIMRVPCRPLGLATVLLERHQEEEE